MPVAAQYRIINNVKYKLCKGPLHREGKFIPVSNYYKSYTKKWIKPGTPRSWCIDCERVQGNIKPGNVLVPYESVSFVFEELVRRLGKAEAARRLELPYSSFYQIYVKRKRTKIRRKTVRLGMLVLLELREDNFARHKNSIKHGSYLRGRLEKQPKKLWDFYITLSDEEHYKSTAKTRQRKIGV